VCVILNYVDGPRESSFADRMRRKGSAELHPRCKPMHF